MTVIDLGEVTHDDAAPAIPLDHRRLLRALLAVLTIVGVPAVAGSAHGTPASLRPLWTTPFVENAAVALDARSAYLSRLEDGQPRLVAYDLATGGERWTAAVGDAPSDFPARPAGDTVLVPTDQATITRADEDGGQYFYVTPRSTVALDADTGDQLWSTDGDAQPLSASGAAIVAEHDDQNQIIGLRLVKLHDGAPLWSLSVPPLADWTPLPGWQHPEAIATLGLDGTARVYGFADGKVRQTGRLPSDGIRRPRGSVSVVPAGQNFAVIRTAVENDSVTTVYSAATLRPLWQTGYAGPCGDLFCSTGSEGVSGHDPSTGRVVWAVPGMFDGWPVGDDRMLAGDRGNTRLQLLDSRTGKFVGGPFTGLVASGSETTGSLLVTRPSARPLGELVVTRVDLADGRQTPLGRFGPSGEQTFCFTSPGYVACPRYDGLHIMAAG
ncbi:PQQ-binding-like beta-propeller repeat protein [Actinoplanes sp. NPDC051513]|uniref:outer membrane protein assembly factor BamB family protein n=1 Tax=Actinoplanes sp. NPDC051513 TaxID=3363908 RepID=UPI0037AF6A36